MDEKVEAYFIRIEENAKRIRIPIREKEEHIRTLEILGEIGLVNKDEQEHWIEKLSGNLFEGIETLNLSSRSYHALYRAGVRDYRQLRECILHKGILNIRNIGIAAAAEVLGKAIQEGIIKEDEIDCTHKNKAWKKMLTNLKRILGYKVDIGVETEFPAVSEYAGRIDRN